ncbi:hypothetical protein H3Z85_22215 [Chryseobacterium indologenes]|uniref:DUF6602 domain-containing protein n=1 Tax=Chryseobacterium indologenes TaxID=253 RepID=UPI0003E07919|nr:DUF6602 domain-containing protein [Chryseobacterium indologenes]QPQ51871.1 hypothetical protein H3Z85_22215 [Chryseobacterium indologenes]GAE64242.1 hypothetical protein CIN01S_07_01670 [Chryseobacterium indologenes NBRC 14944]SFI66953.1 hypothetical protein SAMN05421692_0366 [Chryseobacterium indologenes]SUX50423.1 Uncharacterised protein [Chryseobacterium indologenes]
MSFDFKNYVSYLADELIRNFDYASAATTPVLIGSAKEKEISRKLEMLLPNSVGVGSGCIIDSFGNTSKQMDIIIYEKEFCPIFCINESAETTYYPCEGVIAAGEVKSTLNSKELENIFDKASSVKKLRRYSVAEIGSFSQEPYFSFRTYNSKTAFECSTEENFDQTNKILDQIFFFALCGNLDLKPETFVDKFSKHLYSVSNGEEPNIISILNSGLMLFRNKAQNRVAYSLKDADSLYFLPGNNNFEFLLGIIIQMISSGRTVPVSAFNRYLSFNTSVCLLGGVDKDL